MAKTDFKSIDQYHKMFSPELVRRMQQVRDIVHEIVPDVEETISYQIPCFKYNGYLIYYAAFAQHITLSHPYNKEFLAENYPFSELVGQDVNTLIFPNLAAGNVAYNLLKEVGGADAIGPILLGLKKPVHVLQLGSSVRSIVNMGTIAVIDAQMKSKVSPEEEVKKSSWWKRLLKTPVSQG